MPPRRSWTIFGKRNTFTHTICLRDVGVGVPLQSADLATGRYPSCHPPVNNSSHQRTHSHVRQIFLWNVYRASMCRAYAMSPDCRRAHYPRNGLIPSAQGGNILDRPVGASVCIPQLIFFFILLQSPQHVVFIVLHVIFAPTTPFMPVASSASDYFTFTARIIKVDLQ